LPKPYNLDTERALDFLRPHLHTPQMLISISGSILDISYVKSEMSKEVDLGIKAVNQNLEHMLKFGSDTMIVTVAGDLVPV